MQRRILDPPLCGRESCSHQKLARCQWIPMVSTGSTPVLFLSFLIQDVDTLSACLSAVPFSGTSPTYPEHRSPAGVGAGTILPSYPMKSHSQPIRYSAGRYIPSAHRLSHGPVRVCQNLTQLYAFLIEAVYIPCKALEHNLILKMCKQCTQSLRGQPVTDDNAGRTSAFEFLLRLSSALPQANATICAATFAHSFCWLVLP